MKMKLTELAKTYAPADVENKWYKTWEDSGFFKPTAKKGAPNYCIQLPPPNITGTLHMGHGFQYTLQDALIRYHRMRGFNTLWQAGTDHAGIATQIVVERQLDAQGLSRLDLGREEFINRVWKWKESSENTITSQMRRLGASCDWSRERFTMDEGLSKAVTEVFVSLFEKGYIYRGKRLVNWDVQLQTAVSDLEVLAEEEQGNLWYIRYPVKDSHEAVIIATTRPETMLGDVAVAVNPTDERYQHLIGQYLILPLVGREIPIIADEYVDADFGTGCVKITPAHDFNDYEIGKRHNLAQINIMTLNGYINEQAPGKYCGLERFAARKQILTDLEAQGLLVEVKAHKLMVPRGDRTGVVIEPLLTDQWFVNMHDFARNGLDLVDKGEIRFVPENWRTTYKQWLEKIQDWCISRQLWWGHRIPAYYADNGQVYVARSLEDAVKLAGTDKLVQDQDVLDTWFSSALWCFSTLGWPEKTQELETFLPSSVLVTGFDIIFFWVARMVMFTAEFTGKVPFKDVYVTGLIQDANGHKMSKSKGNIIDPLDLVDGISLDDLVSKRTRNLMNPKQAEGIVKQTRKDYPDGFQAFGADALRFTFAALATHGREVKFDMKRIEGSRNFCNKIWNASRFVLMNTENHTGFIGKTSSLSMIDAWILGELKQLIADLDFAYTTYRFDIASQKLYEFMWNEYCDWYLELAKVNLQSENIEFRIATLNTLLQVLECVLRLMHPLMPFITEELWQVVADVAQKKHTQSIMVASYPTTDEINFEYEGTIDDKIKLLKELITSVRNLRAEMNLNPAVKVPLIIEVEPEDNTVTDFIPYLQALAKVSEVELVQDLGDCSAPIMVISGIRLMLKVEVDVAAEKVRLLKEIEKITKELDKIQVKLDNPAFVARAPQELVVRDTARVNELSTVRNGLRAQLEKLV
jgi:valyl-tRNA synthetase